MRNMLITSLFAALAALVSFSATTFAAVGAEAAGESLLDLARPLIDAVMGGHYLLAASLALVLAVAAVRRYGGGVPWLEWTRASWGAPALVLLGAFGTALAASVAAGAAPSLAMFKAAAGVAVTAAGGWKLAKELLAPALRALQAKLPAKLRPLLGALLWVFDKPGAAAVARAEAAGDAAVAAKPAGGVAAIVGKVKDVR